MGLNLLAVAGAAVAQYIIGWIWYMPLFGNVWGKIHGFNELSPNAQKVAMQEMWRLLVAQFAVTVVTTIVLAILLGVYTGWNPYWLAFHLWLGFVLPTQISAVLFGGTKPEWMITKIAVMAGGSLLPLLVATYILSVL